MAYVGCDGNDVAVGGGINDLSGDDEVLDSFPASLSGDIIVAVGGGTATGWAGR